MSKYNKTQDAKFGGHEFKKSLGQNFISDTNLLSAIVSDSGISTEDYVVEIGAGAGTLTDLIAKACKNLVSFEVDTSLKDLLESVQEKNSNLQVVFSDIMSISLDSLPQYFNAEIENFNYKVVANLPYYITTPIIFKFLEDVSRLKSLTIMVQKEVGERIVAKSGDSEYGALSAMVGFYGDARITRIVKKQNFYPMPKVDSCIVRIDIENNKFSDTDCKKYENLVRVAFNNRRKTLVHNITSSYGLSRESVLNALRALGLSESVRGEKLSPEEFVELIKLLKI